jgi:serine/threonine protein phosphatase PrpC
VHAMARSEPGKKGMGTTLVSMLANGGEFVVANVGDSRAYLVTQGGVRQLTEDHSFVAEAMRRGQREEEARSSPWKDALTRSIGIDADVKVDLFGPFPLEGDMAVVLCSDGLFKALDDADLARAFAGSTDAQDAARRLVAAAYDAGSDDNITVVVAEHGQVPRGAVAAAAGNPTVRLDQPFRPREEDEDAGAAVPSTTAGASSGWKVAVVVAAVAVAAAAFALLRG